MDAGILVCPRCKWFGVLELLVYPLKMGSSLNSGPFWILVIRVS